MRTAVKCDMKQVELKPPPQWPSPVVLVVLNTTVRQEWSKPTQRQNYISREGSLEPKENSNLHRNKRIRCCGAYEKSFGMLTPQGGE